MNARFLFNLPCFLAILIGCVASESYGSEKQSYEIRIKKIGDDRFHRVYITPGITTYRDLKQQVEKATGIRSNEQRIIAFAGKDLALYDDSDIVLEGLKEHGGSFVYISSKVQKRTRKSIQSDLDFAESRITKAQDEIAAQQKIIDQAQATINEQVILIKQAEERKAKFEKELREYKGE